MNERVLYVPFDVLVGNIGTATSEKMKRNTIAGCDPTIVRGLGLCGQ